VDGRQGKDAKLLIRQLTTVSTYASSVPIKNSQIWRWTVRADGQICSDYGRQQRAKPFGSMMLTMLVFEDCVLPTSREKAAKAPAGAAYTLGERNALLMRSVKSAFVLLLAKVTKPADERRNVS
jgi:hypothetical protein